MGLEFVKAAVSAVSTESGADNIQIIWIDVEARPESEALDIELE